MKVNTELVDTWPKNSAIILKVKRLQIIQYEQMRFLLCCHLTMPRESVNIKVGKKLYKEAANLSTKVTYILILSSYLK